jgi:mono/diheme cytochrome c family protein
MQGLAPRPASGSPSMPAFGNHFTDRQIAEIAAYLRARYTELPPWQNLDQAVMDVRKGSGE